ncbi:MAG: NADH-dependent [FeFe] hydrogenase, group A6 [Bacillota bacterium]|nr:NADH-dependent [FeFe] hydrogenase, group A6 [Bacillota bacterium]
MVKLTIDGRTVKVEEGTTILNAALKLDIHIPHLCYFEGLNEIGACRVCAVEVKGKEQLVAACNTHVTEGMEVFTNSPKVRKTRKVNVRLILSDHDCKCATCARSGNCALQSLATDLGILENPYINVAEEKKWDRTYPLIRDDSKCIKCMRCIQVCDKIQSLGVWDLSGTGYRTTVGVTGNKTMEEANCTLCGQCITHCPVGALRSRSDIEIMFDAIADPDIITMVQIAPAVRTAWGEEIGLAKEKSTLGRLVSAMRRLGFDYIFDTNFSADMTIMEEGSEFLERLAHKDKHDFPMFTSCCPGWIRFARSQYPEIVPQLSTAKSPQQMFGALSKTYIAECLGVDPSKIFSVSVMPCMAKKYESTVPDMASTEYGQDVDLVLTTREIGRMIRADHIRADELKEEAFDEFFGEGTGAAVIFGATGGVMEAALRSAYYLVTGKNPNPEAFKDVRGIAGWKEASFEIEGIPLKVAVVSGLRNARELILALKRGEVKYDFVEVMACPGGCSGGGGQPIHAFEEMAEERGKILYGLDRMNDLRFSHENPTVQKVYEEFLEKPLSEKAHHLLHTDYNNWDSKK